MLNLITNQQMRMADAYTCENSNISSVDLMEQAAEAFTQAFVEKCSPDRNISIICGKGNNGGDGLAIARLLHTKGYNLIKVYIIEKFSSPSPDFSVNYQRLRDLNIPIIPCYSLSDLSEEFDVVIDAILGSGFNRSLSPFFISLFEHINKYSNYIVSVDVPSGCNVEEFSLKTYNGIHAHITISFQRPKLLFTLPESQIVTEDFKVVPIGLSETYLQSFSSDFLWVNRDAVKSLLLPRKKFTHKGTYGHVLICAGSKNTRGACLLTAKAALKTGAGLVTLLSKAEFFPFVNVFSPEIMTKDINLIDDLQIEKFNALAIGPGLGKSKKAREHVLYFLRLNKSLVLDADALNILNIEDLRNNSNPNLVITPHVNEFDRLFGRHRTWYERLLTAKKYAQSLKIVIVLKNQYTYTCTPNGKVLINSTGNPAMAQGGMGDVLTGCITALMARGHSPADAASIGCFIHGLSGDILAQEQEVVSPTLLIEQLPKTLRQLIPLR